MPAQRPARLAGCAGQVTARTRQQHARCTGRNSKGCWCCLWAWAAGSATAAMLMPRQSHARRPPPAPKQLLAENTPPPCLLSSDRWQSSPAASQLARRKVFTTTKARSQSCSPMRRAWASLNRPAWGMHARALERYQVAGKHWHYMMDATYLTESPSARTQAGVLLRSRAKKRHNSFNAIHWLVCVWVMTG